MRRRSLSVRILGIALLLGVATVALFTKILLPAERIVLDGLGTLVLGVRSFGSISEASLGESKGIPVVARRADEFQNTFVIRTSVAEGTKVISGNTLVGVVIAQGALVSKVEAISAPGFIIHGVISRSGVPAEFQGKGAMLLEARLPRGTDIHKDDTVFEDHGTPLGIGTVVDLVDIASDPFITVVVQSPVNLSTLMFVEAEEGAPNTP